MAIIRGQSYNVTFYVWKKADLTPYTGSASAITVRISKDGGALATTTNAPTAVDTANAPGAYQVVLTASEMDANVISIYPAITDTNYQCQYLSLFTERGRIDVAVSTRATPADIANTPVTLAGAEHDQIGIDVQTGMTNQGYTTVRATNLDNLNATVSSRAAPGDAMGLTTGAIDALWEYNEANISAGIGNRIKTNLDATVSSRATQTTADAIKQQTDKMNFTGTNINADVKVMSTNVTVGGYASGQSPSEQVLSSPSNKLATDATGRVTVGVNADKSGYSLTSSERSSIASAVWNFVSEGAYTMLHIIHLISSALFGKVSGANTNTPVFRDILDTKDRISMQVDDYGNRSNITLDGS